MRNVARLALRCDGGGRTDRRTGMSKTKLKSSKAAKQAMKRMNEANTSSYYR